MTRHRECCAFEEPSPAQRVNKYYLYTKAFQCPQADVRFFSLLYEQENRDAPTLVREDFCGTAALSCEWIRSHESARAIAIDIDAEPLQWCREHRMSTMTSEQAHRLELIHANVLEVDTRPADVILAPNTSICLFMKRAQLLAYLSRCHAALQPRGMIVIDVYAGPEAQRTGVDRIECDGVVCLWEQKSFNAATNEARNCIHFHFPGGSQITDAFVYNMRIWSPAELRDALRETGFSASHVYRRTRDLSLSPEGLLAPIRTIDVAGSWEAYIVGCA